VRYLILLSLPLLLFSKEFKVASYNVENLFDTTYQGSEYKEYIPNRHNWTPKIQKIKLTHTAEVICDMDADIIALQEVENDAVLEALQKLLKRVGCNYRYRAIADKKNTTIHVALLSKFPIRRTSEIRVNYSSKDRNILEVLLDVDGYKLTIFVNHWKSKSGPESRRIRYAKALRKRLEKMPKGSEYIILGDFNSNYNEYKQMQKRHNDTSSKTGLNHVLQTVVNGRLVREKDIIYTKDLIHYNLWLELPKYARWSHNFYGKKEGLDAILLPPTLFDGKGLDYVDNSFAVFKPHYLFHKRGYINRWEYKSGKHTGRGYSDHLPIYAIFSSNPYYRAKNREDSLKEMTIDKLYSIDNGALDVVLKDVKVILKRGDSAIIKESIKGRGILLYRCAKALKEGESYDIAVYQLGSYRGLKEVLDMAIVSSKGSFSKESYYLKSSALDFNNRELIGEVVSSIEGIYRDRKLTIGEKSFPIYFKQRGTTPKNGTKIKIDVAQIGYYNGMQLVVWNPKDFKILE